jgi:hypothetical protein
MAMVFSNDLLFLHIQKTGGTSVTEYLLHTLPPPVYYMGRGRHSHIQRPGLTHLPGTNHGTLKEAAAVVREYGFELERFPVVIAAIRNPYDLAVSMYSYRRHYLLPWTMLELDLAPAPQGKRRMKTNHALAEVITSLERGKVARIEPTGPESLRMLRESLLVQAVHLGRKVSVWEHEGALYISSDVNDGKSFVGVRNARSNEFGDFMALTVKRKRTFLSKLADYFFLGGQMLPTMKVLRFERLADDVREVLNTVGIDQDSEFPWLNRSSHAEHTSYYDRESERLVYEQCRWLFDHGYYERLDLDRLETASVVHGRKR